MNRFFISVLALLFSAGVFGQAPEPTAIYKQPHAHSSGADLLYYCEKTDMVVDQLRCDYYVQGVADLATIPQAGKPMACLPQGQSRSQLMAMATAYLKNLNPNTLETESAASLILKAFVKIFPCPKNLGVGGKKPGAGVSPQMVEIFKKCAAETKGNEAAAKRCVLAEAEKLKTKALD